MIREVQQKDIPKVLDLLTQVNKIHADARPDLFKYATKYDRDFFIRLPDNPKEKMFVCTDDQDSVQGYAFIQIQTIKNHSVLNDMTSIYIDDICVDESARGNHVGSKLYNHVIDYARSIRCHNVTLNVWEFNDTARKFYESCGMTPQKTVMEQVL